MQAGGDVSGLGGVDVAQHRQELVAAVAGDLVGVAQAGAQVGADAGEDGVADAVAVGVVGVFELVEVRR